MLRNLVVLVVCLAAWAVLSGGWAVAGNHCGAAGDWRSKLIPDQWPPPEARRGWAAKLGRVEIVPVYRACKKHDDCYDTPGTSRAQCDERFLDDMRGECERTYQNILETPLKEACYQAALGYYQAVHKFGAPAFAAARAGKGAPAAKQAKTSPKAKSTPQVSGKEKPTTAAGQRTSELQLWGTLAGARGIAVMHGKLYAYDSETGRIMTSAVDACQWEEFCEAPEATLLAAGQGRLFLWNRQTGEVLSTHINKKQWQSLGRMDGVGSLAVCGGKLICRISASGELLATIPVKLSWHKIGRLAAPSVITGYAGKLYALSLNDLTLKYTHLNKLDWKPVATLSGFGLPALQGKDVFVLDPASGEIFKN